MLNEALPPMSYQCNGAFEMQLQCAFQMEPIRQIDVTTNTSIALAHEADKRGHIVFHYEPDDLTARNNQIYAKGHFVKFEDKDVGRMLISDPEYLPLKDTFDVVFLRQNPPFDTTYLTNTYLLERIERDILIINSPTVIRNFPEKILPPSLTDLQPATLISRSKDEIEKFREYYRHLIIKPLYLSAGERIFNLSYKDQNFWRIVSNLLKRSNEPIIFQKYLSDVRLGDKRVLFLEGDVLAYFVRIPAKGESRAHSFFGGELQTCKLTSNEVEICGKISCFLASQNIFLAGADLVGEHLTEINIISPAGLPQVKDLYGRDIAPIIWEAIERRLIAYNSRL